MKKAIISVFSIMFVILIASCALIDSKQTIISDEKNSVNLEGVNISGLSIGSNINRADVSVFSAASRDIVGFDFLFEEVALNTSSEGEFTKIQGWISSGALLNINGNTLYSKDEIIKELGDNHNNYWFDKEQSLRAITYTDRGNKTNLSLIFSDIEETLIWVILSRM